MLLIARLDQFNYLGFVLGGVLTGLVMPDHRCLLWIRTESLERPPRRSAG